MAYNCIAKLCPSCAWISVSVEGWAASFVRINSGLGETRRYYGYSVREAEKRYREEFGLVGARLTRIK